MHWDGDRIQVTLVSKTDQEIELGAPGEISEISAVVGDASIKNTGEKNTRKLSVRGGEQVTINMTID